MVRYNGKVRISSGAYSQSPVLLLHFPWTHEVHPWEVTGKGKEENKQTILLTNQTRGQLYTSRLYTTVMIEKYI